MLRKQLNIKYFLFLILTISFLAVCSCSNTLYPSYSGRSGKEVRKCEAKNYTINSLYIRKR